MTRLADRYEVYNVMRELFTRCARCGEDLSQCRWGEIVALSDPERPNRLCHRVCPVPTTEPDCS